MQISLVSRGGNIFLNRMRSSLLWKGKVMKMLLYLSLTQQLCNQKRVKRLVSMIFPVYSIYFNLIKSNRVSELLVEESKKSILKENEKDKVGFTMSHPF